MCRAGFGCQSRGVRPSRSSARPFGSQKYQVSSSHGDERKPPTSAKPRIATRAKALTVTITSPATVAGGVALRGFASSRNRRPATRPAAARTTAVTAKAGSPIRIPVGASMQSATPTEPAPTSSATPAYEPQIKTLRPRSAG
jgi:hypothetical protein